MCDKLLSQHSNADSIDFNAATPETEYKTADQLPRKTPSEWCPFIQKFCLKESSPGSTGCKFWDLVIDECLIYQFLIYKEGEKP